MAGPAALAASQAVRSPAVGYLATAIISAPVLFVVGLLMLLGGGVAADATAAPAAPGVLRPGVVPAEYEALVQQAAQTCPGITAPLLAAQLEQESGWNPNAVSPVGGQGLSQFMPGTWIGEGIDGDGDGVRDPFDPADGIASQASFMCKLFAAVTADRSLTGDPIDLALAGYNAGLGAVQRYNGVPPYAETQGYIVRIRNLMAKYADPAASAPRRRAARQLGPAHPRRPDHQDSATAGGGCTPAPTSAPRSGRRCTQPATAPSPRRTHQRIRAVGQARPSRRYRQRLRPHQRLDRDGRTSRPSRAGHRLQRQRRPQHGSAPALRDPHRRPACRPRCLLRRPRDAPQMSSTRVGSRPARVGLTTGKAPRACGRRPGKTLDKGAK